MDIDWHHSLRRVELSLLTAAGFASVCSSDDMHKNLHSVTPSYEVVSLKWHFIIFDRIVNKGGQLTSLSLLTDLCNIWVNWWAQEEN